MKLCKDCKHAAMPNPLLAMYGQGYAIAMCSHPDAKRSVVDGSLQTTCTEARGDGAMMATNNSVCWPDAKLFEQAPAAPEPELKPYAVVPVEVEPQKPSFWRRIFS